MYKYQVITELSSYEDAKLNENGQQILFETNNFKKAHRECVQWAAYDDIYVEVVVDGMVIYSCDGAWQAEAQHPIMAYNID